MILIDNEELSKRFSSKSAYNNFMTKLERIKTYYMDNYNFLNLKEKTWDKLISECTIKCLKTPNIEKTIKNLIKRSVNNYINKKLAKNDFQIFNNLLNELRRTNRKSSELINAFFLALESYNIVMTDEIFESFKTGCSIFRELLKSLNIENHSYEWIKAYVSPEYDLYRYLKPLNLNVKKAIELIDKVISFYPEETYGQLNDLLKSKIKNEKIPKLKFIISNYQYFERLYYLCSENITFPIASFFQVIMNYSLNDLKKLHENIIVYFNNYLDKSFTYKIINECLARNNIIPPKKKIVSQKPQKRIIPSKNSNKKEATIYDKFPNYEDVSFEKKKEIIDYLLSKRTEKNQENIKKYIAGKLKYNTKEYKRATAAISEMKKEYIEIHDQGMTILNKKEVTIYDKFPDYENVSLEKKKEIVDYLLSKRSIKVQENIKKYIASELKANTKEYKNATDTIYNMKKEYIKIHEQGINILNKKEVTIYDKFPDYEDVSFEKKKEIIDYLLSKRSINVQENIKKYIAGKLKYNTKEYKNAVIIIFNIKQEYIEIQSKRNFNNPQEQDINKLKEYVGGLDYEKARLICLNLLMLEYLYRSLGFTRRNYESYQNNLLHEIKNLNPQISNENLLREYIRISEDYLRNDINLPNTR